MEITIRKIALVGTAASALKAPFDDESWEIWGVSARGKWVTRADRWFEMHRLEGEPQPWRSKWRELLKTFVGDVDLYMLYPEDIGPSIIQYPHEHIINRFGTYFMTSTFAWMTAMAIDELRPMNGEPVDGEIGVWGVDMEYGTEYASQRAGFRHFLEMAKAMGIRITRLATGGLSFEPVPYPLWQDDPLVAKMTLRANETKDKLDDIDGCLNRTRVMLAQNRAIVQALTKFGGDGAKEEMALLETEYHALMKNEVVYVKDITHFQATYEEQAWIKDYLTP